MDVTKGCRYYSFYSKQIKLCWEELLLCSLLCWLSRLLCRCLCSFLRCRLFSHGFWFCCFFGNFLWSLFSCGLGSLFLFFCCRFLSFRCFLGYRFFFLIGKFVAACTLSFFLCHFQRTSRASTLQG